jgi:hypothetical protein
MELEASLICLREKEKQLTAKASQVDDLSGGDGQENFSLNSSYFLQHLTKLLKRLYAKFSKMCISETLFSEMSLKKRFFDTEREIARWSF